MRPRTMACFAAISSAGAGLASASFACPDSSGVLILAGQAMLAVLTFPLGVLASAAGVHGEALPVTTPLYAILGYVQWRRLVPRFHEAGPDRIGRSMISSGFQFFILQSSNS